MHDGIGVFASALIRQQNANSTLCELQRCVFAEPAAAASDNCDTLRYKYLFWVRVVVEKKLISCYKNDKERQLRFTVPLITTMSPNDG
ncbi:hypothetical protein QLY43_11545 [Cronobacter dublinensis]|uniref:hypothetical protein n=1 Tax=Cronobacter dublinensis TaxID=413497 RepID=UPI0024AEB321|nr:hypothetical protein [Cronobacter dublinensis]MDI7397314.1 hypothetical protein [Cronobacter dublinensis]